MKRGRKNEKGNKTKKDVFFNELKSTSSSIKKKMLKEV